MGKNSRKWFWFWLIACLIEGVVVITIGALASAALAVKRLKVDGGQLILHDSGAAGPLLLIGIVTAIIGVLLFFVARHLSDKWVISLLGLFPIVIGALFVAAYMMASIANLAISPLPAVALVLIVLLLAIMVSAGFKWAVRRNSPDDMHRFAMDLMAPVSIALAALFSML